MLPCNPLCVRGPLSWRPAHIFTCLLKYQELPPQSHLGDDFASYLREKAEALRRDLPQTATTNRLTSDIYNPQFAGLPVTLMNWLRFYARHAGCCPRHHCHSLLKTAPAPALSSAPFLSLQENSHPGTGCNAAHLTDKTKQTLLLSPFKPFSYYPLLCTLF